MAKKHPAHHAPVEHRSHHAAKAEESDVIEAPVVEEPILEESPPDVVELPETVVDVPPEPAQADSEAPAVVEVEPPAPRETTLADYFGCRCGDKRNLSMEGGVYHCHGCGDEHSAQTLEGRKAAGK